MTLRLHVDAELWLDAADANPAFRRCTTGILTEVIDRFARASIDYEDGAQTLGIKGQYADINRKVLKLKRAMWDDKPLACEPIEIVLSDLIAHCLLTLDMLPQTEATAAVSDAINPSEWCQNKSCLIAGQHTMSAHMGGY